MLGVFPGSNAQGARNKVTADREDSNRLGGVSGGYPSCPILSRLQVEEERACPGGEGTPAGRQQSS